MGEKSSHEGKSLSLPDVSSDSLGIGTRSSTLDFITSSDSFSGIVLSSSFPIMREPSGSKVGKIGVIAKDGVTFYKMIASFEEVYTSFAGGLLELSEADDTAGVDHNQNN
ncbi:hypothetical protein Tco_0243471 [Tanacetum coccineum]